MDPFVIYNPVYAKMRDVISAASHNRDYVTLEELTTVRMTYNN